MLGAARGELVVIPSRAWLIQASGGAVYVSNTATTTARRIDPVGSLRARWRSDDRRTLLDGRVTRTLLDATPQLIANRVMRSEVAGRADVPISGSLRARLLGRYGALTSDVDNNRRLLFGGGPVFVITPAVEFSASLQRVAFRHATTAGYFAPHHVNLAELATYAEFESGQNGAVLAIDAGAGAEQITKFGASQGAWHPALRLWSQLTYPFTRTVSMLIEIDSYSTRSGPVVATAENWRSLALRTGARLGL